MKKSKLWLFLVPLSLVGCGDVSPSKSTISDVELNSVLEKAESGENAAMVGAFTYYDSIEDGAARRRFWMIKLAKSGDVNFIQRLYEEDFFEAKSTKDNLLSCNRASNSLYFAKQLQFLRPSLDVKSDIFKVTVFLSQNCNKI